MRKTYYLLMIFLFLAGTVRAQTSTEAFETESAGSTSFTDNGVIFNIISHVSTFDVGNFSGKGWSGTVNDSRYIENTGSSVSGASFSIKTRSNLFKVNRFWVFLADPLMSQNAIGSLTITGKLNGVTKFTQTKTTEFATGLGSTNGYTLIDLTNLNGQNYSNIIIDELRLSIGGAYTYLGFDAFTWVKDSGLVLAGRPVVITSSGTTAFTTGNNTAGTPVAVDPGITVSDADNTTLASGTVSITGNLHGDQDGLVFSNHPATMGNISGTFNSATGVLSLSSVSPAATLAQWQAALRSVTYTNSSSTPNTNNRTISFSVNDGNLSSFANTKTVSVNTADISPPIVTSVTSATANGSYRIGQTINISVNFSEVVSVTGTPKLSLNSSGTASYISGAGSSNLIFSYLIGANQNTTDLDYASVNSLNLDGGSIRDVAGNNTVLSLPMPGSARSLGANANIVINGITPTVLSIVRKSQTTELTNANSVEYTVTFSETVTGVDVSDFQMSLGSTPLSSINSVVGSGETYTVTVGTGVGDGIVAINLRTSGTGITNQVSNPILSGFGPSETYTIDKSGPTLSAVRIGSGNFSYVAYAKVGSTVALLFTASESIHPPTITIGGATVTASPAGGYNWVATYVIPSSLAEGEIPFTIDYRDQAGNVGTTQTTVNIGSMVTLDKTKPTLSNVSISSNNLNTTLAKPGDAVTLTFTASESIAKPSVTLYGSTLANVTAQGNNVWTATYTLGPIDNEGLIPFEISYSDFAGNAGIAVSTTNDASTVTYDRTLPVAPNFLGVTAGDTQNTMTWFLNADYAKYELIGGAPDVLGNAVLTTVLAANATNPMTYTQTGLTNFNTYYYALRVTDAAGNVNTSYTANGTPLNVQTITFDQPVAAEYGSSFTINATSSSGLPVTLTSNEPALATISGNTVTIVGVNSLQSVSIIATQPGNGNYSYATPVIRLLQIKPKPVTVTATAQTKVYGDAEPTLLAPTISPALIGSDISTGILIRVDGDNAGNYEIQQNDFSLDQYKYAITYVPANFTISKKPVTITPQLAYSKAYGQDDPAFAYNFTPLVSNDVITGDLARVPGENVGTYNFDLGTLTAGSNYDLKVNPLPQFKIDKSVITVTPVTASIQYGDAEPVIDYNHTPALKTGDDFTGALSRAPGDTPNNYLINQGTLALSNNYTLNFSPIPVDFVVLKKNISIKPTAGQGKIYDELDGTITYASSPALLNGDTFSGALDRAAGSVVNNYSIGIGSLAVSNPQNYNLQLGVENYAITKKAIQVIATAVSQTYGDEDPLSLPYTLSAPLANGDVFTGKLGRTRGTDVGTYPINLGNLSLSTNYDLSLTPANLSIIPKTIAITALSDAKTYGSNDPELTYTSSPALVMGDTFTGALSRAPGENVNTYVIGQGDLALSSNYTLNYTPGFLTIEKAVLTVTADNQSKVYGAVLPTLTASYSGYVNGDTQASLIAPATLVTNVTASSSVAGSPYTITASGAVNPNYTMNYVPGVLTVTKAALTITAIDKEKFVGMANPVLTASYSGFVNGETEAVLTTEPTLSTTAITASQIGEYPIKVSGADATNYSFSYVDGVLKVRAGGPTNVILTAVTLYENTPTGTSAGTLSSTSDDPDATFTYSLVAGNGDTDNALFGISGTAVRTAAMLNYETKGSYSIRVRSTTQYGFSLDKVITINVTDVNEAPTLAVISDQIMCYSRSPQNVALTGISGGPETGQMPILSVSSNNADLFDRLSVSGTGSTGTLSYLVKAGANGTATVTVTVNDGGGTDNGGVDTYSRTFVITVSALPVLSIDSDKGTQVSKGETIFLNATGASTYVWATDNSIITGGTSATLQARPRETTTYTVTGTNVNGCSETQSITITVLDDMEKIKVTNILTPNGDGFNDKWVIDNIDFYPNNEVKVFNKGGRLMFAKRGYDNSWDGTYNGVALAEGTYYYVIDFGTGKRVFKGFITIVREN